ncbi:acyl carrier protein phosphodiesterase [Flavobacterium sp. U410]
MNYLAHIYLSGDDDLVKIGNFMADGIKGHEYEKFPTAIQKGILLHRQIDYFTDFHPVYRHSKHLLHKTYGHYSGVIMDMYYDHLLAVNWSTYSDIPLNEYIKAFYAILEEYFDWLTPKMQRMVPKMIEHNWLGSYATIEGMEKILYQMDSRTQFRSKMQFATKELKLHFSVFENDFNTFFQEIIKMSEEKLSI